LATTDGDVVMGILFSLMDSLKWVILHALLMMCVTSAVGQGVNVIPDAKYPLPKYCTDADTQREMIRTIGGRWGGIHHYCWALVDIAKAQRAMIGPQSREFHYRNAIGNIDYVLIRTDPDFVLRPELLTRRAEVLHKLKREEEAEDAFREAMHAKEDYWPAYRGLAELFLEQSNVDGAREVLERGLGLTNNARALKKMLDQLPASKVKR